MHLSRRARWERRRDTRSSPRDASLGLDGEDAGRAGST
jgi:hypothetical protein